MNRKVLLSVILVMASFATLGQAIRDKPNIQQWEYKFEYSASEKKANEFGAQGWELVAIQSTGPGLGNNVSTYVFKRFKQN